ncbi:MAG TPA: ROK family protein [Candidatus Kapabacteria bacterium]|jgi:glucokinase|nr:ROK family protein [Candidatus Kapabacteria bacterium]
MVGSNVDGASSIMLVSPNPPLSAVKHPLLLGVDIGGTTIKIGVVEMPSGIVRAEAAFPTPQEGARAVATEIAQHVRDFRSAYPEVDRLGVGVPGAMNLDRSLVRYPPNFKGWKEEPLRQYLTEVLPEFSHIEVDNDAKVATLAEAKLGAGQNTSHFLLVTLGTGVGGGIYCKEGNDSSPKFTGIFRGASGGAGEFGHTSIDFNGPLCNCGARGCIEAYLGQHYLSERTRKKLLDDPSISSPLRSIEDELTPKLIADAMNSGDAFARSVFEEAGMLLGVALANTAKLLDIHVFIVGGGVADAGPVLFDAALTSLRANVLENLKPVVEIRRAAFGNRAGIIGAAMLVA